MTDDVPGARALFENLKNFGVFGHPLMDFATNWLDDTSFGQRAMKPPEFVAIVRALEQSGYVQVSGQRTVDDLAVELDDKSPAQVFHNQEAAFSTAFIRPTLRGYLASTLERFSAPPAPPLDMEAAAQKLADKRTAGAEAAARRQPMEDYEAVLNSQALGDSIVWDDKKLAILKTHHRLMDDNPVYQDAFDSYKTSSEKLSRAMQRALGKSKIDAHVSLSQFGTSLFVSFIRHPGQTIANSDSISLLKSLYRADQKPPSVIPSCHPEP